MDTFLPRLINALIWSAVLLPIFITGKPVTPLTRRFICIIVFTGFWLLTLGGSVQLGFASGEVARWAYTVFCGFCGLVGLALLTMRGRV